MNPSRGEVWLCNLDPARGDEIRKMRPAVVVSQDGIGTLALRVIVPITAWNERFESCEWLIRLAPDDANGLAKVSAADTFQVRSIAIQRFARRIGQVSQDDMNRMLVGLHAVFDL